MDIKGEIATVCYENDVKVLPTLAENLENLKKTCGIKYEIRNDNYLTSQNFIRADFYKKEAEKFDMIIGNPPYLKIAKDAQKLWQCPKYATEHLICIFCSGQWVSTT